MTILYTKEQLETVGINFPTLQGLDVKEIRVNETNQVVAIVDVESDEFYLLPQEPIVDEETITRTIETTEETDKKVMITVTKQEKLLDEKGKHKSYYPSHIKYEQVDTGEVDEEGNSIYETVEVEIVSESPIYLYTTIETEEQKKDEEGNPLFYKEVTETVEHVTEVEDEWITVDDERWTEELQKLIIEQEIVIDNIQSLPQSFDVQAEIEKIKQRVQTPYEYYEQISKLPNVSLDELKLAKIDVLKKDCEKAVFDGFYSAAVNSRFGMNELDQLNMSQQMILLIADTDNLIKDIYWKTKDNGIVVLTKNQFFAVVNDAKNHKLTQQQQYWDLETLVLDSETSEQVDSIVWE